jgi:histone acetyltransferase (RNA polymerase elongator complex component)
MMTGLYCDTPAKSLHTCGEIIALKPDTVRIYPTVVFPGTSLAEIGHEPFPEEATIELCAEIYGRFVSSGIRVIRLGLNYPGNVIGERCMSRYYCNRMLDFMRKSGGSRFVVCTDKRNISKVSGHKGENRAKLLEHGYTFKIKSKNNVDLEIKAL